MFRRAPALELLLGHMGGPFWARRSQRAWSVPKGGIEGAEEALETAQREFREETGIVPPPSPYIDLGAVKQRSGKVVRLFAVEAEPDLSGFRPGTFTMTRGGRSFEVPEIDRVAWATADAARTLLVAGQVPFVERLQTLLMRQGDPAGAGSP